MRFFVIEFYLEKVIRVSERSVLKLQRGNTIFIIPPLGSLG
jgi:hypothetical protein